MCTKHNMVHAIQDGEKPTRNLRSQNSLYACFLQPGIKQPKQITRRFAWHPAFGWVLPGGANPTTWPHTNQAGDPVASGFRVYNFSIYKT
jgi:hypothetical protein